MTFSADGPYRAGETALVLRGEYTWIYKPYDAHAGLTFIGQIIDITHTNDVTDGPNMSIQVSSSDEFDLDFS